MPKAVNQQNLTGVDPPSEAREVVTSQGTQVGVVRVAKSAEEVRNVTIVLLVVALDMWLVSALERGTGIVDRETASDYSSGTQNSRQ